MLTIPPYCYNWLYKSLLTSQLPKLYSLQPMKCSVFTVKCSFSYRYSPQSRDVFMCHASSLVSPEFFRKCGPGSTTGLFISFNWWVRCKTGLRLRTEENHHDTAHCCSHPNATGTWKLTNEKCPISVSPQLAGTAAQVGFLGWQQQAPSQGRWNMSGSDYTGSRAAEASGVW